MAGEGGASGQRHGTGGHSDSREGTEESRRVKGLLQTQSVVLGAFPNCSLHCSLGWFKRPKQLSVFKVLEVQCHAQAGLLARVNRSSGKVCFVDSS